MQSRDFVVGLVVAFLLGMLLTWPRYDNRVPVIEKRLERLEAQAR